MKITSQFQLVLIIFTLNSCVKNSKFDMHFSSIIEVEIENKTAIEGYIFPLSYFPADTILFKIHSLDSLFSIKIYNSQNNSLIYEKNNIIGVNQNYTNLSFREGCDWKTSHEAPLPKTIKAGFYYAEISNSQDTNSIHFVIKKNFHSSKTLVIANTNTWQAYNYWGGGSFYRYNDTSVPDIYYSPIINYLRPNTSFTDNHLIKGEVILTKWLTTNNYSFNCITDIDLHSNENLKDYKVIILNVHPEYWTENMRENLVSYLENGGNLMCLGANAIYWKVVYRNGVLECRKDNFPHVLNSEKGGLWQNLGLSESSILGSGYTRGGYDTYHPYKVLNKSHWIFNNTNLNNGDTFGKSIPTGFASGHETDKINSSSPANIELIAKGTNKEAKDEIGLINADTNGGADMIFFINEYNGAVFSAGSITYTGGLLIDSNISQITKNVLDSLLKR
jgi:hypothetical protein